VLGTFLIVAVSAAGAASNAITEPHLLNRAETFTAEDYPRISQASNEEGTVFIEVGVNAEGFATSCKATKSSGHIALDEQTCALVRSRGRFSPATDSRGRPIEGKYINQVNWTLEGDAPQPLSRQAWTSRTTIGVGSNGQLVECSSKTIGTQALPTECESIRRLSEQTASDQATTGAVVSWIMETYFYPVDSNKAPNPPAIPDAELSRQQMSRVGITPDGRVGACQGMSYSGTASPQDDACVGIGELRFTPSNDPHDLVGTIFMRVYLLRNSVI